MEQVPEVPPHDAPLYIQSDTDIDRLISLEEQHDVAEKANLVQSQPLSIRLRSGIDILIPELSKEEKGWTEAAITDPALLKSEEYLTRTKSGNRLNSELQINLHHEERRKKYGALPDPAKQRQLTDIDFEGILNLIGGCNKWQMIIYCIIVAQQIPHAMFNLSVVYMMYQPDHWCKVEGFTAAEINRENRGYTWEQFLNSSVLFREEKNRQRGAIWHEQCMHVNRDWSKYKNYTLEQLKIMKETVVSKWNRVCDDNWSRAHVHLAYSLGYLVGCFVGGMVSDRYGRRTAILFFGVISLVFGAILPFVDSFPIFLFVRFCLAASNEAGDLAAYVLCMEVTGVKYRSLVGSLLHAPWALGYSFLALVAYLCKEWTGIHVVTCLLHSVAMALLVFVPESPRWLIISPNFKENTIKAERIIRQACNYNKSSLPSDLELVRHAEKQKWLKEHEKPGLSALFRSREMGVRMAILSFIWTATALVYYGLVIAFSDQSSPGRSIFAGEFFLNNAIAGAVELPTLFLCVFLLKKGRKQSQAWMLFGAGASLIGTLFTVSSGFQVVSLCMMLTAKAFVQSAFNILYIFTAELNPTVVRNSAVAFTSTVARLGSAAAGYLAILSDVTLPIVPMIIFAVFSWIAMLLVYFLPETSNKPLPDTIWDAVSMHSKHKPCMLSQEGEPFHEDDREPAYEPADEDQTNRTVSTSLSS